MTEIMLVTQMNAEDNEVGDEEPVSQILESGKVERLVKITSKKRSPQTLNFYFKSEGKTTSLGYIM
jgi:hypothetical protein